MRFAALFGNPSIEKVLFFILINEKCYATQLRLCLGGALTPIQQALNRLEGGGILTSLLEGKTRLFRFDPRFPCLRELEALLKQGFTQLSLLDQQRYYCPQNHFRSNTHLRTTEGLQILWQRLLQVKALTFSAQSRAEQPSGWNGVGKAEVEIKATSSHQAIFQEKGIWTAEDGKQFDFKNIFRWSLNKMKPLISLEHLRHGLDKPVLLFELTPINDKRFETLHPYLCRQDTYLAHLSCERRHIDLHWRIIGPRKNEEIHYIYS